MPALTTPLIGDRNQGGDDHHSDDSDATDDMRGAAAAVAAAKRRREEKMKKWKKAAPYPLRTTALLLPAVVALLAVSAWITVSCVDRLQRAGKPPCRKSLGAFGVLRNPATGNQDVFIWSGVSKAEKLMRDSWLFMLDMPIRTRWHRVDEKVEEDEKAVPEARTKSSMATLGDTHVVMFGGDPSLRPPLADVYLSDTWLLTSGTDGGDEPHLNWIPLVAENATKPQPRRAHAAAVVRRDARSASYFMYGGRNETGAILRDVWELKLDLGIQGLTTPSGAWRCVYGCDEPAVPWRAVDVDKWDAERNEPIPRKGHTMVSMPTTTTKDNNKGSAFDFVTCGGRLSDATYFNDCWGFSSEQKHSWVRLSAPDLHPRSIADLDGRPTPRDHHASFANTPDAVWIFGGRGGIGGNHNLYGPLGDLWKFNITASLWEQVNGTTGEMKPAARWLPGFDLYQGDAGPLFVLFGGESFDKTKLNDLWVYEPLLNEWTMKSSSTC